MNEEPLGDDEFECALCHERFTKGRSDEETRVESESYFGRHEPADLAVVCDDCWQKIHPERN